MLPKVVTLLNSSATFVTKTTIAILIEELNCYPKLKQNPSVTLISIAKLNHGRIFSVLKHPREFNPHALLSFKLE